jgi:hypothetical protein
MDASQTTEIQAPGLGRKIGLAWAALAWEGLWPRLVPLLAFVALFIAAAHLDLFAGLDPWVHTGLLAVLALAFGALGWWRLRDFAWPTHEAAIRRPSSTAACRTGRWSPCRIAWPRARTI